ncbi:MAG: hypothetical protein GDA56_27700 [Hormoscilla sp. GM7CHS1pb]|nr:hypothetical protein [Hormoscilla sp. GM7CHS1pb]
MFYRGMSDRVYQALDATTGLRSSHAPSGVNMLSDRGQFVYSHASAEGGHRPSITVMMKSVLSLRYSLVSL